MNLYVVDEELLTTTTAVRFDSHAFRRETTQAREDRLAQRRQMEEEAERTGSKVSSCRSRLLVRCVTSIGFGSDRMSDLLRRFLVRSTRAVTRRPAVNVVARTVF